MGPSLGKENDMRLSRKKEAGLDHGQEATKNTDKNFVDNSY